MGRSRKSKPDSDAPEIEEIAEEDAGIVVESAEPEFEVTLRYRGMHKFASETVTFDEIKDTSAIALLRRLRKQLDQ